MSAAAKLVLFACYVVGAVWTAGAMNATARAGWYQFPGLCHDDVYVAHRSREDFVFSVLAGVFPPGWIAVVLITGAYQDGWTMKTGPACNARGLI